MGNDLLATRWEGTELLVLRGNEAIERIAADDIERVILVCNGGDTPSALDFALFDLGAEHLLLPASSGIAGRVYFERQAWWTQRAGIYWVTGRHAPLPQHLRAGASMISLLRRHRPALLRLPAGELAGLVAQWPLQGPQTWEQRKWAHISAGRHLGALGLAPRR
jgi:hypothetical protein